MNVSKHKCDGLHSEQRACYVKEICVILRVVLYLELVDCLIVIGQL